VLDHFEEVTKRPELMLEFTLQPGEMYFINNYRSYTRAPRSTTATARRTGAGTCCASGSMYRRCGRSIRTSRAAASRRCPAE
jgi:hypothetical protein